MDLTGHWAGFAALLITDVPAVFELGSFAILGVLSLTALSLTALPAALLAFPRWAAPRPLSTAPATLILPAAPRPVLPGLGPPT